MENEIINNEADDIAEVTSEVPEKQPEKRGPGRPRKSDVPIGGEIKEENIIEGEKPKRTYNKKKKESVFSAEAIGNLAKQIEGIHMLAAQVTGIHEIALTPGDSQALAVSVIGVCSQYDLAIDGKTGAALQLLGTAAIIYIPRYFAFRARNAKDITPVDGSTG